jgi:hypothetical protein
MSNIKYKVTGSFLDRTYYSRVFEIDTGEYEADEDIEDYLKQLAIDEEYDIPTEWKHEGSEDRGGGFEIESIQKIS